MEIMLSLSTIIIFLLFALKPTAVTIIDLLQQIKEKQATLAGLTKKVSDLQTAGSLLQQNQAFIPNVNLAVFSFPRPNIYAQQILGLAAKNSVDILGFSMDQITLVGTSSSKTVTGFTPLSGDAKEMPFSLSIRGSYPNLASFLKDIENLRVSTKIDSLGINSSVSDKGLVITAVISGRVPYIGN